MNWQYLRYFEVVAREEHFTRAADKLHMTQSALSKSIDNLEKDIGIPLFEQYGRNIKLTRYGQIFYNHVSAATSEIEDGLRTIRNMVDTKSGEVKEPPQKDNYKTDFAHQYGGVCKICRRLHIFP